MARTESRDGILYRALIPLLLLGSFSAAGAASHHDRGTVLPLQDRSGNPQIHTRVQTAIEDELQIVLALTPSGELRDELRRRRIRDANDTAPDELRSLAASFDVQWLFSATLHMASEAPLPRVTVSAWAFRVEEGHALAWAGFRSRSGLDSRRVFNRGAIGNLETLAELTARELVQEFRAAVTGAETTRRRVPADRNGFLSEALSAEELGTVAVLPFQAVTDRDSIRNAETMTALARAALYRAGVPVAHPGHVSSVLRRRGIHLRNELDPLSRAAVGIAAGAEYLLAGTVETWESAGGLEPNPRIAFSARLVEIESGRIVWINGVEQTGWGRGRMFGTGRVYDPGTLAEVLMDSLVEGFLEREKP